MRLDYGDFSMLFTGDHNEESEPPLIEALRGRGESALLDVDVLKVPHHGSNHAAERFFKIPVMNPAISVASMGHKGWTGKWGHPSAKVIEWTGGVHRFFSTYIHERPFDSDLLKNDPTAKAALVEKSHVLIETDGIRFRVVELAVDRRGVIPGTKSVEAGDGTRWILAK